MPSSEIKHGVPAEIESSLPPEISSLSEHWLAEQWMLSAGMITNGSADTLLMYAYAQKGVADVKLEIDNLSEENHYVSVRYFLKYQPKTFLKYKLIKRAERIRNGLLRRLALLFLVKLDAPFSIPMTIKQHATEYLPPGSLVEVTVVE